MRPQHLIVDSIYDALGGVLEVEKVTGIPEATLRTWEQSPQASGRPLTVKGLMKILAATADEPMNTTLRELARELIAHFSKPANLQVRTDDPLDELRYVQTLLENRVRHIAATTNVFCPECGEKLVPKEFINGVPNYACSRVRHEPT